MTDPKHARAFEMTIDLPASLEEVWEAVTKAEELVRWFPLQADVKPGPGGTMRWSWGEAWTGMLRIDAWEPQKLLRLIDENGRPYDAEGRPIIDGSVRPTRIALEITLQTSEGGTRLRLVHSGFGRGAAWDDEIEGISAGWQNELRSLQHYLARHRGHDRRIAYARGSAPLANHVVWSRLWESAGIVAPSLEAGKPYRAQLSTGDTFTGTIQLAIPGREFSGIAAELADGIFRISTHSGGGRTGFTLWAASYSLGAAFMKSLETRLQDMLDAMFAVA